MYACALFKNLQETRIFQHELLIVHSWHFGFFSGSDYFVESKQSNFYMVLSNYSPFVQFNFSFDLWFFRHFLLFDNYLNWLFHDYLIMIICNYLTLIIWTCFIIILIIWLNLTYLNCFTYFNYLQINDYLIIIWKWLFVKNYNDYL